MATDWQADIALYAGKYVPSLPSAEGTLVKFFHIVDDAGREDVNMDNDYIDSTRIVKIGFFPVSVDLMPIGG